jgi:hypothetical protein
MTNAMHAMCGRGVLLQDVIDHLEMDSEYFKKKTMMISVGSNHKVYKMFKEQGLIK